MDKSLHQLYRSPFFTLQEALVLGLEQELLAGFYSSFTYVRWRQKSLWTAFWVTALSHGLYNLAIFSMVLGNY